MTLLPLHTQIEGFEVLDNCLAVNGRKLTEAQDKMMILTPGRDYRNRTADEIAPLTLPCMDR